MKHNNDMKVAYPASSQERSMPQEVELRDSPSDLLQRGYLARCSEVCKRASTWTSNHKLWQGGRSIVKQFEETSSLSSSQFLQSVPFIWTGQGHSGLKSKRRCLTQGKLNRENGETTISVQALFPARIPFNTHCWILLWVEASKSNR